MTSAEIQSHYEATFGPSSGEKSFDSDGAEITVVRLPAPGADLSHHLYATVGGSRYPLPGAPDGHRLEFYAELVPDVSNIGRVLAVLAMYPIREGLALGDSHTVDIQRPVSALSLMHQVLLFRPSNEFLSPLVSKVSGIHVDFLQVVPVYESEVSFKQRHGLRALFKLWESAKVEFWNPGRPLPAIPMN
jgi:hypothetical protein